MTKLREDDDVLSGPKTSVLQYVGIKTFRVYSSRINKIDQIAFGSMTMSKETWGAKNNRKPDEIKQKKNTSKHIFILYPFYSN